MYKIENRGYETEQLLKQDDSEMLDNFVSDHTGCDRDGMDDLDYIRKNDGYSAITSFASAMQSYADESVDVYYYKLMDNAEILGTSEYWDEALRNADTNCDRYTIYDLLSIAWSLYNGRQFEDNEDVVIMNIAIEHFNTMNRRGELSDELMERIDKIVDNFTFCCVYDFNELETIVDDIIKAARDL